MAERAASGRSAFVLAAFMAPVGCVAAIGGAVTSARIAGWYAALEKPWFNPPNWVFGPAWTVLYVLMAVAAWLVWRTSSGAPRRAAMRAWGIQLALNLLWSLAFFGAESPPVALAVILALEAAIVWTIRLFWPISRLSALLLVPYAAWVAFAAVLNLAILALN